jgi:hypothetical protein
MSGNSGRIDGPDDELWIEGSGEWIAMV